MAAKNEHGLTPQQEAFAMRVAAGSSLAEAYRQAYPRSQKWKPEAVWTAASVLAADRKVYIRVANLQAAASDKAELDVTEIVREIRRISLSDIKGVTDENGKVKLPHELDPATRAAVKSFKLGRDGIEYQFWDKNAALEKAARIKGLYQIDNDQKTKGVAALLASLTGNVIGPVREEEPETPNPGASDDDD